MQKTARLPRQSVAMKQSRRRENIAGYLFMAPSLLFFLGFVIFPMVMCLVYSFTDYTMTSFSFAGLGNYQRMFQDAVFGKALWNTIILVLISVPVTCFFSLWAASIISKLHDRTTSFSAACSICRWSPVPWRSRWCGNGSSTAITAC